MALPTGEGTSCYLTHLQDGAQLERCRTGLHAWFSQENGRSTEEMLPLEGKAREHARPRSGSDWHRVAGALCALPLAVLSGGSHDTLTALAPRSHSREHAVSTCAVSTCGSFGSEHARMPFGVPRPSTPGTEASPRALVWDCTTGEEVEVSLAPVE